MQVQQAWCNAVCASSSPPFHQPMPEPPAQPRPSHTALSHLRRSFRSGDILSPRQPHSPLSSIYAPKLPIRHSPISTFLWYTSNLQPTDSQTFVRASHAVAVATTPGQGVNGASGFCLSGPVFAATDSLQTNLIPRFSSGTAGSSKSFVAWLIYSANSLIVTGAQNDTSGILIASKRRTVSACLQHHGRGHAL